jgi:phosphatidate cytidylyltransferase
VSPSEAFASPVFRFYLVLAAGLLAFAGVVLGALRWGGVKALGQASESYRAWLVLVPLVLGAIFLGRLAAVALFTGVALLGFKEFARATGLCADRPMTAGVYLGILAAGVAALVRDPARDVPGWYGLFSTLPVYVTAGVVAVPVLRNRSRGQLRSLALAALGFGYFGWMFGHLAFLANARHAYSYLLYLLFAVELNDVAAYVSGKLFGRHPLRDNISPKKTWEGCLGALALSLALPWALHFTFPHFRARDLLAVGLLVGVGGQLGDLAVSVIKRDLGLKDMGTAIPGHGGILDRSDSLTYVAPLFFHYTRACHGLY